MPLIEVERITHDVPTLEAIQNHCRAVATSRDPEELRATDIVDDYLYYNTAVQHTGGLATYGIIRALDDITVTPRDPEAHDQLRRERALALTMLIRGIIQGKQIPVDDFPVVFDMTHEGFLQMGLSTREAHARQRRQAVSVWRDHKDWQVRRRAAEAYMPVGRPLRYGIMMTRVAVAANS